jgi:hypothetical protein
MATLETPEGMRYVERHPDLLHIVRSTLLCHHLVL